MLGAVGWAWVLGRRQARGEVGWWLLGREQKVGWSQRALPCAHLHLDLQLCWRLLGAVFGWPGHARRPRGG